MLLCLFLFTKQQLEQQHTQQPLAASVVELDGLSVLVSIMAEDGIEQCLVVQCLAGLGV